MILSKDAQDLLEQLWVTTKEEKKPGLSINGRLPAGAGELLHQELAEQNDRYLVLTSGGHPEAVLIVRRHRLAERLLADVFASDGSPLDEHACLLEYTVLDSLVDNICTLLGHPSYCPHGKPIPSGACCRQKRETVSQLIAPLSELQPSQRGRIAYIQMNNPRHLQKLMAMSVLPGLPITLHRRFPSYVFETGYSQFAVDEDIAADIYVQLTNE